VNFSGNEEGKVSYPSLKNLGYIRADQLTSARVMSVTFAMLSAGLRHSRCVTLRGSHGSLSSPNGWHSLKKTLRPVIALRAVGHRQMFYVKCFTPRTISLSNQQHSVFKVL
jgi:hypothetical protein